MSLHSRLPSVVNDDITANRPARVIRQFPAYRLNLVTVVANRPSHFLKDALDLRLYNPISQRLPGTRKVFEAGSLFLGVNELGPLERYSTATPAIIWRKRKRPSPR